MLLFFIMLMLSDIVSEDWTETTGEDMTSDAFFPSMRMWDLSASEIDFMVLKDGSTSPDSNLAMSDWLTPAAFASSDCVIPSWTLIFLSCLGSIVETDTIDPS